MTTQLTLQKPIRPDTGISRLGGMTLILLLILSPTVSAWGTVPLGAVEWINPTPAQINITKGYEYVFAVYNNTNPLKGAWLQISGVNYTAIDNDLRIYVPFDNNAGIGESTTVIREILSNTSLAPASSIAYVTGKADDAVSIAGSADIINLASLNSRVPTGAAKRTAMAWVNQPAYTVVEVVWGVGGTAAGTSFELMTGPGYFRCHSHQTDTYYYFTPAINTWYHFACSYDGSTVRLYLDGIYRAQTTEVLNTATTTHSFGCESSTGCTTNYFTGYIDDFRLYNDTLSQEEIGNITAKRLYVSRTSPTTWILSGNATGLTSSSSIKYYGLSSADALNWTTNLAALSNGQACTSGSNCVSGNCIDGVCCDTSCGSTCQRCSGSSPSWTGTNGTCSSMPSGQDPDSECPGAFGTCASTTCGGSTACAYLSGDQGCAACTTCSGASFSCSNYADHTQDSTGCSSTCKECLTGSCVSQGRGLDYFNQCVGECDGSDVCKAEVGLPSTTGTQCWSSISKDGVCCDSSCGGTCLRCDQGTQTILTNGGFEGGSGGTAIGWGGAARNSITRHGGTYSLGASYTSGVAYADRTFTVSPSTAYTLSGWVWSNATGTTADYMDVFNGGTQLCYTYPNTLASGLARSHWKRVSCTFNTNSTQTSAYMRFVQDGNTGNTGYGFWDEVTISSGTKTNGTCSYIPASTDPDSECPGSGGSCYATTCSGSLGCSNTCGYTSNLDFTWTRPAAAANHTQDTMKNYTAQVCARLSSGDFSLSLDPASAYWSDTNFNRRKNVTIQSPFGTLANFPGLVNVTYDSDMQADYDDLRFYSAPCGQSGGSLMYYDLEYYDATSAKVWLQKSLTSGANTVCMYYGSPSASSGEGVTGTWNSNYGVVYHMTTDRVDSTSNARNAVATVGAPVADNTLGYGTYFDGVDDGWTTIDITYLEQAWNIRSHEIIFKTGSDVTTRQIIFAEGGASNGNSLYIVNGRLNAIWLQGAATTFVNRSVAVSANTLYHVVAVYGEGSSTDNYYMMVQGSTGATGTPTVGIASHTGDGAVAFAGATSTKSHHDLTPVAVNSAYFKGTIYEIHIVDSEYSTGWWNQSAQMVLNQNNFVTQGSEERYEGTKDLIPTTPGSSPFWTSSSNPQSISMSMGQCTNITWIVNATGNSGNKYDFFAIGDPTGDIFYTDGDSTPSIEITIGPEAAPKSNGQACAYWYDCSSNICKDGVCCNTACDSTCQRCAGSSPSWTGTNGTCSNIVVNYDPDAECGDVQCDNGASTPYFWGWDTAYACYWRIDVPASTAACGGSTSCKTAADYCPSQGQDGATGVTCQCAAAKIGCSSTTAGSCNNALCTITVNITSPQNNSAIASPLNVTATISGELSNFTYSVNGSTPSVIFDSSLVGYWSFNNISALGESNTVLADQSLYGNNGIPRKTNLTYATGRYGLGTKTLGPQGGWNVSRSTVLKPQRLTISAWFYPLVASDPSWMIWVDGDVGNSGNQGYDLTTHGTNAIMYIGNNTAQPQLAGPYNVNSWNHFIGAFNGTHLYGYMNGVKATAGGPSANNFVITYPGSDILLGDYRWSDSVPTGVPNGTLDEVMIWNRSLSDNEMLAIYKSNLYKLTATSWMFLSNETLASGSHNATISACSGSCDIETVFFQIASAYNPRILVSSITNQNPTQNSATAVNCAFDVYDISVNASSVQCIMTKSGETTRTSTSCTAGGMCFQEFANVSTSCGGLDTGSYDFNNGANDGDWTTGISPSGSSSMNYSKPSAAKAAYLNASVGTCPDMGGCTYSSTLFNLSAAGCFNQDPIQINFLRYNVGMTNYMNWSCYTGSNWYVLSSINWQLMIDHYVFFEEAMVWDMPTVCPVNMLYYDAPGTWAINATLLNSSGSRFTNATQTFTYNNLMAMATSPSSITFGTLSVGVTQGASNDPIIVYNQGNSYIGNVSVKAYDLTSGSYQLSASAFNVSNVDAAGNGAVMSNNTYKQIPYVNVNVGSGTYSYMYTYVKAPQVSPQTYSSSSNWVVAVFA